MGITKAELKELPKSPIGNESRQNVADFIDMQMNGMSKKNALKAVYPNRYQRALDRAGGNDKVVEANLMKEINQIERSKYAQGLLVAADKHWYNKWITKKTDVCNMFYDTAMSSDVAEKDRINAGKAFMQYTAKPNSKLEIEHTHKIEDDFKEKLLARKRELHSIANDNVIDVEVENDR